MVRKKPDGSLCPSSGTSSLLGSWDCPPLTLRFTSRDRRTDANKHLSRKTGQIRRTLSSYKAKSRPDAVRDDGLRRAETGSMILRFR